MNVLLEAFLVSFYTFIFLWLIRKNQFFLRSGIPKQWLYFLFILKLIVSIALYLIYTKFYTVRSEADIFKYFDDSAIVFNALKTNVIDYIKLVFWKVPDTNYYFENYLVKMNYWANPNNSIFYGDSILMIKINAFFRLFSLGSFHVHVLFFNFLSFVGLVAIYRSFKAMFYIRKEWLIGALFLLPSVLFWSSSVLKESLLLFFLGIICFNLTKKKQYNFTSFIIILFSLIMLVLLKFYVALPLVLVMFSYLINKFVRKPFVVYPLLIFVGIIIIFNSSLLKVIVLKQQDFIQLVENTNAGSYFEIPVLQASFLSVLQAIPQGILNCFVRPLPNSSLSIMALPALLENLLILVGIGFAFPQIIKKKTWVKNNINSLLFLIVFTLLLFSIIGITTPVAGALVRYKVAALPFLGIFILYFLQPKIKK